MPETKNSFQVLDSLTVRELRVVDSQGRERCCVSSRSGGPYFHLLDEEGRPRLVLHLGPDGAPNVSLFSAENTLLMNLSWSSLWFVTESGAHQVHLGVDDSKGFVFEAQLNAADADNQPKPKMAKRPTRKKRK